jgi:hypothetical protein
MVLERLESRAPEMARHIVIRSPGQGSTQLWVLP